MKGHVKGHYRKVKGRKNRVWVKGHSRKTSGGGRRKGRRR